MLACSIIALAALTTSGQAVAAEESAGSNGEALTEVIVTGSRVITNGNEQPTPVTVVSAEQLMSSTPSTVATALQELPVFAAFSSPSTDAGNSSQIRATRSLNMRDLGANRTLVLLDGVRVAPISATAGIDVSYIPSMLLQRVDVVTGGASAVYGSDAVAGVVNFITDRRFNGLKADINYGISQRGDNEEEKVGVAGGMSLFGGRGHIEAEYEFNNEPGISSKLDRSFGAAVYTVQTINGQRELIGNTRISTMTAGGYINGNGTNNTGNPLRDMQFCINGVLCPFAHGTPVVNGIEQGGSGVFYDKINLVQKFGDNVGFGRFDFDLSDTTHLYATASAFSSYNFNTHFNQTVQNVKLSVTNAFLAPQYQAQMQAAGLSTFTFSRFFDDVPPQDANIHSRGLSGTFGAEGSLGDYKWNAFYAISQNVLTERQDENPNTGHLLSAIDAVTVTAANVGTSGLPIGSIQCNVSLTNPGLYPGCVPLNMFGPTAESQAAVNYIFQSTQYQTTNLQHEVGLSIAGPTFHTWAGPVQSALSGEFRRLTYSQNGVQLMPQDCTGIRFGNCTAASVNWGANVLGGLASVVQTVAEGALETNVPLLKNVPLAKALNVTGAVRFTNYNTTGSVDTWKLGLDWDINDSLRVRATRSLDIRAPTLSDTNSPTLTQVGGTFTDFHVLTNGSPTTSVPALQVTQPNPQLVPEVGRLWSAGLVFQPSDVPGFSASVDWFEIVIKNAIQLIQTQGQPVQQICEASGGTSIYCSLILRPHPFSDHTADNLVTEFILTSFNAALVSTSGWDAEVNYGFNVPATGGRINLRGLMEYQPHLWSQPFASPRLDQAGTANPDVPSTRATAFLQYVQGPVTFDLRHRYRSRVKWDPDPAVNASFITNPIIPSMDYTDVTLTYRRWTNAEMYLSVQNVFDRQPSAWANTGGSNAGLFGGFIENEDLIGRYFTFGLRAHL
jgi:outer membrane receptor protein involved in Fe transport